MPVAFLPVAPFCPPLHPKPHICTRRNVFFSEVEGGAQQRLQPVASTDGPAAVRLNPLHVMLAALPSLLNPMPVNAANIARNQSSPTQTVSSTPTSRVMHRMVKRSHAVPLAVVPKLANREVVATASSESVPKVIADSSSPAPSASVQERVSFYLSEFLMWNPASKVVALLVFTLVCMYFGSFLYRFADPSRKEVDSPFWHSVRAIANPMEDDWQKNSLRATSIALASIGMVVFAILVGMVTETVESAVTNADGQNSRVVVSDHILVCGWGNHVSQILKDVKSVTPSMKVVVLANSDRKDVIMDQVRATLTDKERKNVRIFYRPGAPIIPEDLEKVAAAQAKKIILVNQKGEDPIDSDRQILSSALALRQNLPTFSGDVVAELNNSRDEGLLRKILANSRARSVETVNAEQLLFRFMAQAIRQPGLADVVASLMGDNAATVFHVASAKEAAPQLVGTNFKDLRPTSVPGSILCGFFDRYGELYMENGTRFAGDDTTIEAGSKFLLLGASKSMRNVSMQLSKKPLELSAPALGKLYSPSHSPDKPSKPRPESYLVCGWRHDMESMVQELDSILPPGSKVTIIDEDAPSKVSADLKNLRVSTLQKRVDRYDSLEDFIGSKSTPYDHVVILGSALGDDREDSQVGQSEDTKTLATLVYVNDLLAKQRDAQLTSKNGPPNTKVTVEFVNERVASMVRDEGNVANVILPQNLSAKIAAQTVRDNRLNAVWNELLSQRGREVYLRAAQSYDGVARERKSFASLADELAVKTGDIVIGYISRNQTKVLLNPREGNRFNTRLWDEQDTLVVLSLE